MTITALTVLGGLALWTLIALGVGLVVGRLIATGPDEPSWQDEQDTRQYDELMRVTRKGTDQ